MSPITIVVTTVLLATLLTGCAETHELAMPEGPVFGLNAGHWTPTPEDLALSAEPAP